jgi:hypothetical protein
MRDSHRKTGVILLRVETIVADSPVAVAVKHAKGDFLYETIR